MRSFKVRLAELALGLAAALAIGMANPAAAQSGSRGSTAVERKVWSVRGLTAPADIVIDHWGIPHIFADSPRDAYFLQGYNAARDRLWQIDLWRKRGLGRLSASFGAAYIEEDRAARLFLYRGDQSREWSAYAPDAASIVQAFVAGINAYVLEVKAGAKPTPLEFTLTQSQPELWAAEDVVRIRSHALVSNIASEVMRARVACAAGLSADALRRKIEPLGHKVVIPQGLDPCAVPATVLKDYLLATQAVDFSALAKQHAGEAQRAELSAGPQLAEALAAQSAEGSNNWVIAPSRTATGRPILANDPHRTLGAPSLRYIVGLSAPGLNIIGAGEPALPGVSFGHNDDIAFGLTIFAIDQEDLYVYALNPKTDAAYRYKTGWEPIKTVRETIEVKGGPPREVELKFTRHGPVLAIDPSAHRAFAMRTVWSEPGLSGYFGSSRLLTAKTWEEFRAAANAWGAPPLNLIYADVRGNIGWRAAGRAPVRPNWDGLMPVPGDGRYEWAGFQPDDALPAAINPPEGYAATANEMNLPAGYPNEARKIAFEWADRSRITRIKEVLGAAKATTLADSMALQTDVVSAQSRRATALLAGLPTSDPGVKKALNLLAGWNHAEEAGSVPAAIYEVWATKHLGSALVAKATPEKARALVGQGQLAAVLDYLERPDAALGADPVAARNAILLESLKAALDELKERLGPEMDAWRWGRLHHALFEPAAAILADPQLRAQMTLGPLELPGSASSPRAQTYRGSDFAVTAGASVRLVMDVGAWDNSVAINTPGESGDPMSAHYRDLFPLWAEGRYAPLLFSREAVERDAETMLHLEPSR